MVEAASSASRRIEQCTLPLYNLQLAADSDSLKLRLRSEATCGPLMRATVAKPMNVPLSCTARPYKSAEKFSKLKYRVIDARQKISLTILTVITFAAAAPRPTKHLPATILPDIGSQRHRSLGKRMQSHEPKVGA